MDDEPGLGVGRGGTAMIVGLNEQNATSGNVAKAALLATMFNLRIGAEVLQQQGFPRTELILSGGLTKTPELGQLLADVLRTPVTLLVTAEEGTAWGAALMAGYRHECLQESARRTWSDFLGSRDTGEPQRFSPDTAAADNYDKSFARYRRLMEVQPTLDDVLGG